MRRRQFIALLGSAAATWPLAARAQQGGRVRRIGVLMPYAADDPQAHGYMEAFLQRLQELGWMVGRNVQIDYRWTPDYESNSSRGRAVAAELVALAPDVILTSTGTLVNDLQSASRSVPIVFAGVADAVGSGRVESLARPGANATGFSSAEFGLSPKWLELLKQIAPQVKRVAVLRGTGSGQFGFLGALQAAAPSFGVELRPVEYASAEQIERNLAAFAREPNGGLIGLASANAINNRALIARLSAQFRLPGVYGHRLIVEAGGLASYGPVPAELYRQAAGYVDRILRGEKAADLPVQAPTKYELVINLKTAKALGLEIPPSLLALADEVIE
jgi:putative ABC transport system substrate-binding protein